MAKKSDREGCRAGDPDVGTAARRLSQKPSALLDTRVIYCGDNLERPARLPDACARQMTKEECRIMNLAPSLFLHSSFILLPSPVIASHYVKVMLDQIFGENKKTK